jgi:hypothetical protein
MRRPLAALIAVVVLTGPAPAIIITGAGDGGPGGVGRNTLAPTAGPFLDAGWQYTGFFGGVTGVPIDSRHFVTATHVGNAGGGTFSYANGTGTTTNYSVSLAGTLNDLAIWRVNAGDPSFTLWAPLYTGSNEVAATTVQPLFTVGRGTGRGPATVGGWEWGGGDGLLSWGSNTVSDVIPLSSPGGDYLLLQFDNNANPNEGTYSTGDSGGAVFIRDPVDLVWKLAGVNFAVELVHQTPGGPDYPAALYDARGYFDDSGQLITGLAPVPLGAVATRISSRIDFINSVTVPEPGTWALTLAAMAPAVAATLRRGVGMGTLLRSVAKQS